MIDVAIIGAGASGLISAISAKRENSKADVAVFESNPRVAKKLITTGNGRCNITNQNIHIDRFHGEDLTLVEQMLSQFGLEETVEFFSSLNIPIRNDGKDKLYPASFQAQSVVDALRFECERIGVKITVDTKINSLSYKDCFILNNHYKAKSVIVACGSKSGVRGETNGYGLLKKFGHTMTEIYPSIVPIKTETESIKSAKGMKADVLLTLTDGIKSVSCFDEILFTDYGVSGPVVMQISRFVNEVEYCTAHINFLPYMTADEIKAEIQKRISTCYGQNTENLLLGLINKRIGFAVLKQSDVSVNSSVTDLTKSQIDSIVKNLYDFTLNVKGVCGFEASQVTAGGVKLNEFDGRLQSKLQKNLFACGEVLDVDGDCGGFNLQWAWTSGYLVGKNAVKSLNLA